MVKIMVELPMSEPINCGLFSPIYRAIKTVMPIANCVITKVTRLSTWLPVDTAERPEVVPNLPTTSKSTAPYAACKINAPRMGTIKEISFFMMLPCVKSDFELFKINSPLLHDFI